MSLGIGAYANIILEDEKTVIYEYSSYNLNEPVLKYRTEKCDGNIIISKHCFVEPEIHEKIKRNRNGKKKLIVKRILVNVDYQKMIDDGYIEIKNCGNCWLTSNDEKKIDIMALHILFYLFRKYQITGKIPEHINYDT